MVHLLHLTVCFLLTVGIRRPRLQLTPSPPSSPSGSRPCGLIYSGWPCWSFCPSSSVLAVALHRLVSWTEALQPRCRCHGAVLGRSAVSTMPPPLPSQPLDGGLPATTVAAPTHRRHGSLPSSSVSSPVSSSSSPLSLCSCYGGLASEPGMLAYAAAAAVLLELVLLLLLACSSLCCCYCLLLL
jgi:hypothetical protein